MPVSVEVIWGEAHIEYYRFDRGLRDHHRSEHRLLGLEILRWNYCLVSSQLFLISSLIS
jgi:hypothetical protein